MSGRQRRRGSRGPTACRLFSARAARGGRPPTCDDGRRTFLGLASRSLRLPQGLAPDSALSPLLFPCRAARLENSPPAVSPPLPVLAAPSAEGATPFLRV